jgi:hypothetical protein
MARRHAIITRTNASGDDFEASAFGKADVATHGLFVDANLYEGLHRIAGALKEGSK